MAIIGVVLKFLLQALLFLLLAVFVVRGIEALRGPDLSLWHSEAPDDARADEIDRMSWAQWMAREDAVFAEVIARVVQKLPAAEQLAQNRYWAKAPMHAAALGTDWNRSFTLSPDGPPRGVAVMLHGMTDAPYSLRHIALDYQAKGFEVVAVRLPGHGTVPAGLAKAKAEDWAAATRLAVREARRRVPGGPLHLVGYSNGGALAVMHSLDAIADPALHRPDRIVLLSPMIGLTRFARFAGVAGWPAILPAFAKAAWLDIIPEYNPYKYNSFPVNGGKQAHRLTVILADKLASAGSAGLAKLPPVLAFVSVVDSTVDAPAVMTDLFDRLPANGSELVLFDINRAAYLGPLVRASALTRVERFLPTAPRAYRTTIVASGAPETRDSGATGAGASVLRSFAPGTLSEVQAPLAIAYPRDFYSLSHIALPFPLSDGLYGAAPDPADRQGVQLGALAVRGENGVLSVGMGSFNRASSNPFFPWMLARIEATMPAQATGAAQ